MADSIVSPRALTAVQAACLRYSGESRQALLVSIDGSDGRCADTLSPRVSVMTKVFVSHAYGDKNYCDEFLDSILVRGMGLNPKNDIFYSSERDTGVPSGADLMSWVRREVGQSTLVIAIITPLYSTRPVCMAELGAAWGKAGDDHLFPLLAPGVSFSDLDGVLPHALCPSIIDRGALLELYERASKMQSVPNDSMSYNVGVERWLAKAPSLAKKLKVPEAPPTAADYKTALNRVEALVQALEEAEEHTAEWKARCDLLLEAKDSAEARQIMVGDDVTDQFKHALTEFTAALRALRSEAAAAVIFEHLRGDAAPYPNVMQQGHDARDEFDHAIKRDLVSETTENWYEPNLKKRVVRAAVEAAKALREVLKSIDTNEHAAEWFSETYGLEPRLTDLDTWADLTAR